MIADASNVLDKALEKVSLSDINQSAIMRLKEKLEQQGQTFKYDVNLLKKKYMVRNFAY